MKRSFISSTINGGVRVWSIERYEDRGITIVRYNYLNSDNVVEDSISENKTAYNRRIKDKLKNGYVEVPEVPTLMVTCRTLLDQAEKALPFREPMKCQKYDPSKFNYPCAGQPKFNGLRCYIIWGKYTEGEGIFEETHEGVMLLSSEGNQYRVPQVADFFVKEDFCNDDDGVPNLYYDGELYVHGEKLNTIKSRIPIKINGTWSKPALPVEPVKFYCFDVAIEDTDYKARRLIRYHKLVNKAGYSYSYDFVNDRVDHMFSSKPVAYVQDVAILSAVEAQAFTDCCIKAGFEGSVLRDYENVYRYGGRPADIIKIKRFEDGEFTVIDLIPKPSGDGCLFVCRNDINDATFECNPMGSHVYQLKCLADKDKLIGKQVTIKYYERSGVKKCPWHGNVLVVRDYE